MTAKIKAPQLSKQLDITEDFRPAWEEAIYSETAITGWHFKNLELIGEDLSGLTFQGIIFENCRLMDCRLDKSSFIDAVFIHCDMSNSTFSEGYFNRCQWQECKWLGASFVGASLQQMKAEACNLQYVNFDEVSFGDIAMLGSDLSQAALSSCRLKNFTAKESRFLGTNFFRTSLRSIDFSENELEAPIVSDDCHELQGMVISPMQALELVKLLGVVVK